MSNLLPAIEKLKGRDNYGTWKFAVQTYLQHEGLWEAVLGKDKEEKNITKARAKIILLIEPCNYSHVQSTTTAKEAWERLEKAFEDAGLSRKVGLLRKLVSTKLENCKSVDEYVNEIMITVQRLRDIKFDVNEEWVGTLLLAGLPEAYKPMIMGIESSGATINADFIKTKLLQDVKENVEGTSVALVSKKNFKAVRCFNCNKTGHYANRCPLKRKNKEAHITSLCCAIKKTDWYVDSGASAHMVNDRSFFHEISEPVSKEAITADNSPMKIAGVGKIKVDVKVNKNIETKTVDNVQLVPDLCANLLSVSQLVNNGKKVIFDNKGCRIYAQDKLVAEAKQENGMFILERSHQEISCKINTQETKNMKYILWHRRMGHIGFQNMKLLKSNTNGVDFVNTEQHGCPICAKGKQSRLPFQDTAKRAGDLLEIIHSDVCGPIEELSLGGSRYFLVFVDDFTRKVFVYIIKSKDEVFRNYEHFKKNVENQTGKKIKILRTDNGKEFCNESFKKSLSQSGILHQTTAPYTPQQNGVAERMNRTLVEKARCMLFDAQLDKSFWAEAISSAAHIVNRSPCRSIGGKTPEEAWSGRKPDLGRIRVFGCKCSVHIPKEKRRKFDSKSEDCIFVGYSDEAKAYRVYNPYTKKTSISRDVIFYENQQLQVNQTIPDNIDFDIPESEADDLPRPVEDEVKSSNEADDHPCPVGDEDKSPNSSTSFNEPDEDYEDPDDKDYEVPDDEDYEDSDEEEYEDVDDEEMKYLEQSEPKKPRREPKSKQMVDFVTFSAKDIELNDPKTVEEALNRGDKELWKEAMAEEYKSLLDNNTWDLVDLPSNRKPIDCKWVFKIKRDSSGKINRYKARLVVKGCAQKQGIDYEEVFSPVIRYSSIRFLLAMAAKYDLDIDHMDAVTAFLQGDIKEEIYMLQPEGFGKGHKVCRLKKSLYGLKQASRMWNLKLSSSLKKFGLIQSAVDPCVYFKIDDSSINVIAIYVDDLLLLSNDRHFKRQLKNHLMTSFQFKDFGEAREIIGLKIERDRRKGILSISQKNYIEEILARFNMTDCNSVTTPLDPNQKFSSSDSSSKMNTERVPYQEAVGCILYAAQATRPDIAYAASYISRFNKNPSNEHWNMVKRILRYLKGTADVKLIYKKNSNEELHGYCDADWANDPIERRSMTGYVFCYQGGAISWNSKKQATVALSTCEAEYMALAAAAQESLWLQKLQEELTPGNAFQPMRICCDNKGAINLSKNSIYHARSKHIDVKHHFVRELINGNKIDVRYVPTQEMKADILTKGLNALQHQRCFQGLGLQNLI